VEKSDTADGKASRLGESVTPMGGDGLTEVCADGKHMQIFCCNENDRQAIGLEKIRKNQ
jgi:hypothetical protein